MESSKIQDKDSEERKGTSLDVEKQKKIADILKEKAEFE